MISPKPIQPHLKLHSIDSRVWDRQTSVGNMLIADPSSKGSTVIVEELKAQSRMSYKVYVRCIQRYRVVAEEDSAAQFKIRDSARGTGEVPLQVKRIKRSSIGILSWSRLPQIVEWD